MVKDKFYTLIITLVLFVFTFYFSQIGNLDKIFLVSMLVLLWIFGAFSFKKSFLNEINYYNIGYFISLAIFLIFSVYLIIFKYLPPHNENYITFPLVTLFFIIFIFGGALQYIKYSGLKINSPEKIRVPKGLIQILIFQIYNNKPFDCVAKLNLILPSNVSFRNGSREMLKDVSIKANHILPLRIGLKSIENKQSRFTFIKVKDDSGKEVKKKIEFLT